ncbi:MAG: hypothetical protein JWL76_990 [Thermoleophilia bacterium]|nr:hypothetical protein [Thermoleophilia bacterium]
MMPLPRAVTTAIEADAMLASIVRFTRAEMPFVSQVAQRALKARSLEERERAFVSLYELVLEHEQPYVSDLANELLCWIERERDRAS